MNNGQPDESGGDDQLDLLAHKLSQQQRKYFSSLAHSTRNIIDAEPHSLGKGRSTINCHRWRRNGREKDLLWPNYSPRRELGSLAVPGWCSSFMLPSIIISSPNILLRK